MKFSISSGELVKGLSSVIGAVPNKATLPILETVLIEAADGRLGLSATDLEISIVEHISADIEVDGSVCVPAKRLLEILRQLPDIPVYFDVDDRNIVRFKTDKGDYKLVGEESADFPELPKLDESNGFETDADVIKEVIKKTSFAVSTDDLRPAMMGVFFQIGAEESKIVATDGHRLVKVIRKDLVSKNEMNFIVPEKALNLVLKALEGDSCMIYVSSDHVQFKADSTSIITRLINEVYPNYEAVIPRDNEKKMKVDKQELLATVRRVSVFSSTNTRQIRMSLKSNTVEIQAEDIDMSSEAKEAVPCEFEGESMVIGFNARYLADVITNVESDDLLFEFSTPNRAGVVRPADEDVNQQMLMLVMPVMLNSHA
ncbi:DNA polymerase III subunit beta [bacterium]|nr:MAG: DNA polymerase III subunit beta [bacterium]